MASKITKTAINNAINEYIDDHRDNKKRQSRLKVMVEKHGAEFTALACGFTETTLLQYIRLKSVGGINENSVLRGERIFEQLNTEK